MVATEAMRAALDRGRAKANRRKTFEKQERLAAGKGRTREVDSNGVAVLSRAQELERGILSVSQLDDEELAWKKCKNLNGNFDGPRFEHSPRIYQMMDLELLERGARSVRKGYVKATETLVLLLDHHDARVQIQAIDRVMERIAGKVPDKLLSADVTPHSEAQTEIAAAIAKAMGYEVTWAPGPQDSADVIEGEVVTDVDEQQQDGQGSEPGAAPSEPASSEPGRQAGRDKSGAKRGSNGAAGARRGRGDERKPQRGKAGAGARGRGDREQATNAKARDLAAQYATKAPRKLRRT